MSDKVNTAPLHIVTGSDNNYAAGVMVLIASAAFHNPEAIFTVLDMGIAEENRQRIDALRGRLGVTINRIEVDTDVFSNLSVKRKHLTTSTYLRFLLPSLLPDEKRVLYMDCDMLVLGDLTPIWQVDLEGKPLAAVPCPSPGPLELAATKTSMGTYINAGLLVMDLDLWRKEDIVTKCLNLLQDTSQELLSEDQSALNIVCTSNIKFLPAKYNIYTDPKAYKATADVPNEAVVLHYVVNSKPWQIPSALSSLWHLHANRIADLMPQHKISLKKRISLLNKKRQKFIGMALRQKRYIQADAVEKLFLTNIVAPYMARFPA